MAAGGIIDLDFEPEPDAAMVRGEPQRRCYETKMTFLRQEAGFLRKERREFSTFVHCHDEEPSFKEMQHQMAYNVPMHPPPKHMNIVSRRELTRQDYLNRF